MDFGSIALAALCMLGVCGAGMWLMMRGMDRFRSRSTERTERNS
jgi:hypothetical protein